jgi:hypothetical protein
MAKLILLTQIYANPLFGVMSLTRDWEDGPLGEKDEEHVETQEWSLAEYADARQLCEKSSMKSYLYLVGDGDDSVLVERFE